MRTPTGRSSTSTPPGRRSNIPSRKANFLAARVRAKAKSFSRRSSSILLGLLVAGLAAGRAQGRADKASLNPTCLSCHASESLAGSVHAKTGCVECHRMTLASGPAELPHAKTLPPPNCTETCHRESRPSAPGGGPAGYPDSVHGRAALERGAEDVAHCWDCHGKHNIKRPGDPESTVNRRNIPLMCSRCHENQAVVVKYHIHAETPYQEYRQSVHGRALFEKGLLTFAAVCTDCHGVHDIQGVGTGPLSAKRPETCGRCHVLVFEEYKASIHGREALKGNADAPLCVDCHGEHRLMSPLEEGSPASRGRIPDTCSGCHARPDVMRKYGVPEDRIQTFIGSLHGIAAGFGSRAAANCSDCHGVHDIRPAADPASLVNPAHLAATCGRANCHPGMPEKIRNSKIHVGPDKKTSPLLFTIQRAFLWAVIVLVAVTVVWFAAGLARRVTGLRSK